MENVLDYIELLAAEPYVRNVADDAQLQQLARFMALLVDGNERMNLTAIRAPEAMARLHFADSLAPLVLLPWVREFRRGADIGSGAGFPAVPLAICQPASKWVAIESIQKKANFIREAIHHLGLKNLEVVPCRAEEFAHGSGREQFDLVVARAVGPFIGLCEIGLPMLRAGGRLVLYKTAAAREEAERAKKVLSGLGGQIVEMKEYRFPHDRQPRLLWVVERTGVVPAKYPRGQNKPFKDPLA